MRWVLSACSVTRKLRGAKSALRTTMVCSPGESESVVNGGDTPIVLPSTSTEPQGVIAKRMCPRAAAGAAVDVVVGVVTMPGLGAEAMSMGAGDGAEVGTEVGADVAADAAGRAGEVAFVSAGVLAATVSCASLRAGGCVTVFQAHHPNATARNAAPAMRTPVRERVVGALALSGWACVLDCNLCEADLAVPGACSASWALQRRSFCAKWPALR